MVFADPIRNFFGPLPRRVEVFASCPDEKNGVGII